MLVWLIVFCKIDKLTLLKLSFLLKYFVFHKTAKYSNQNKLFSVHFQEKPGFKGKRKRGLTLTLYKKTSRYRLRVSPPRKRTKTSSSTPNLKSPSIRTPSLLKKSLLISKYLYPFKRVSTPIRFLGGDTGNIQTLYIEMFFCKESMSVPLSSFP